MGFSECAGVRLARRRPAARSRSLSHCLCADEGLGVHIAYHWNMVPNTTGLFRSHRARSIAANLTLAVWRYRRQTLVSVVLMESAKLAIVLMPLALEHIVDQPGHPLAHSLFPLVDSLLNYDTGKYFATEDFHAYADKTLAGVGGRGSGKWTRVKLPRRLYQPGRGTIRIDGQDIGKVTQRSLREASAYNIVYGPQHRLSIAAVAAKIAPVVTATEPACGSTRSGH
jgi:hypothetical protein